MPTEKVDLLFRGFDTATPVMRKMGKSVASLDKGFRRLKLSVVSVVASVLTMRAARRAISASIEAFARQEKAERRVGDALALVGENTVEARDRIKEFAKEMQDITTIGDEAVLEMSAVAATLGGLTGPALEDATKAAIGLSVALGADTTTAIRLVAKAAKGQFDSVREYGITLDKTMTDQEKFNFIMELGTKAFSVARGEADTATGALDQMRNKIGDLVEIIGGAFAPMIQFIARIFREWDFITPMVEGIATAIKVMSGFIITYVTSVVFVVQNFGRIWDLTVTVVQLAIVKIIEDVRHWVLVISQLIVHLVTNWRMVLDDMVKFTSTVMTNLVMNMVRVFTHIPQLLSGAMDFSDLWVGLTEGFEATILKMPEIVGRQATALEKFLQQRVEHQAERLKNEYVLKITDVLNDAFRERTPDGGAGVIPTPEAGAAKIRSVTNTALESRFLTRAPSSGGIEDQIKTTAKEAEKQTTELKEVNETLTELADAGAQLVVVRTFA